MVIYTLILSNKQMSIRECLKGNVASIPLTTKYGNIENYVFNF